MIKLPVRLDPIPITETTLEIRFSTSMRIEEILALLYGRFITRLPVFISLPAAQMPIFLPLPDPNMAYLAHYQFSKDNLQTKIGPRVLAFANIEPYVGWQIFYTFVRDILERTKDLPIIGNVERIGLRYINLFKENILDKVEAELTIAGERMISQPTYLRLETKDADITQITQLASNVDVRTLTYTGRASLIDIDCCYDQTMDSKAFYGRYEDAFTSLHESEKNRFFSLLTEDFLSRFNPVYE